MIWESNGRTKTSWMKTCARRTALETFVSELEWEKLLRRKGGHGKVTFVDSAMDPRSDNEIGNHPNEIIQLHVVVKNFKKHPNPNSVWRFHGWNWWRGFRCSSFVRNMAVRVRRILQNNWWTNFISEWFNFWSCWCWPWYFQSTVPWHVGCYIPCIFKKALRPTPVIWTQEIPDFCMLLSYFLGSGCWCWRRIWIVESAPHELPAIRNYSNHRTWL